MERLGHPLDSLITALKLDCEGMNEERDRCPPCALTVPPERACIQCACLPPSMRMSSGCEFATFEELFCGSAETRYEATLRHMREEQERFTSAKSASQHATNHAAHHAANHQHANGSANSASADGSANSSVTNLPWPLSLIRQASRGARRLEEATSSSQSPPGEGKNPPVGSDPSAEERDQDATYFATGRQPEGAEGATDWSAAVVPPSSPIPASDLTTDGALGVFAPRILSISIELHFWVTNRMHFSEDIERIRFLGLCNDSTRRSNPGSRPSSFAYCVRVCMLPALAAARDSHAAVSSPPLDPPLPPSLACKRAAAHGLQDILLPGA